MADSNIEPCDNFNSDSKCYQSKKIKKDNNQIMNNVKCTLHKDALQPHLSKRLTSLEMGHFRFFDKQNPRAKLLRKQPLYYNNLLTPATAQVFEYRKQTMQSDSDKQDNLQQSIFEMRHKNEGKQMPLHCSNNFMFSSEEKDDKNNPNIYKMSGGGGTNRVNQPQ